MKLRHGLFAALFMAVVVPTVALAGGMFQYPAVTLPLTGAETVPADTNLGSGLTPQTETITINQLRGSYNGTNSVRNVNVGGTPAIQSTDGNDSTPVATEVYIGELSVNTAGTATGACVMNGSVASGNYKVGLASSAGAVLATSASTAMTGTDTYQCAAFTTAYSIVPGVYYLLSFYDNNTARYNTFAVGKFGASKQTAQVYATGFTTITPPTTFTTALAPIGGLY